jgi:hypothetical protein
VVLGGAIWAASEQAGAVIVTLAILPVFFLGVVGLVRVWRIRRLLAREHWRVRPAWFGWDNRAENGPPMILLEATQAEPEAVVSVSTTTFRWDALNGASALWIVGNPLSRFAAVATTDGEHVFWVTRPWTRFRANRLRRIASES